MRHRPFRIGLTGSIGMGKSTAAAMFRAAGVPVFDADAAVHQLQGPGGALLGAIEARFPGTTSAAGVDRRMLGARVIGQPEEMRALERIVHPAVAGARAAFLRRHRSRPMVVLDIPLLFETRGERHMGMVVVVSAAPSLQRRRVLRRPGMTVKRFEAIKASQLPDHLKRRRADLVLDTAQPKWRMRARIFRLVACLRTALVR
ncbi:MULTISPECIES: dephospho-CoA kinase [unclassified Sphingobium]|uniref:dephospho-CoA kinase n=1 Tax=unclassified Sphingobium TaxID=2611147 RepID=UPI0022243F19|nr:MULTISPECIES: dephospho-CoA kinase [unclassified Sphingobium]MCW2410432.1 dephospho-CoA kinase [Sphingobium sp. B8D3D]MCW2413875.1 dephospho-CoA kinase [Sphingobium sp. B8D3A]